MELTNQKYRVSEVGMIPDEWDVKELAEIAYVIGGSTPSTFNDEYWNGNINWFTPTEIGLKKYSYESVRKITKKGLENSSARLLPVGSILLTSRAGIGDVSILMNEACTNQGFQSLVAKEGINIEFLYYIISTLKQVLLKNASGSTFLEISPKKVKAIHVALPPTLNEQTSIATALSDIDVLIEGLEKLIVKKRNIKQGVIQDVLKLKDGCEVKTLGKVATFRRGSFPQPYGLDKWYDDNNGYPFVQVFDVDENWKLKSTTKRRISEEAQRMSVFVAKGSIILTIQGSIGRIAMTQYDAYLDRTLLLFESFLVPFNKYYFMLLVYLLFEKEKEKAPGGTIKTITKEALSGFTISYPKIEEQNRIAEILLDMDDEIRALEGKLEKQRMLKQGMMQVLLTGKIRLS